MVVEERLDQLSPAQLRERIRHGELNRRTAGLAPGYVQASVIILPKHVADEFILFCLRNPRPLPLIDVTEPGDPEPRVAAPGADIRTDQGMYAIFRDGQHVADVEDIRDVWRDDLVSLLLGCSLTFDAPLMNARVPMNHLLAEQRIPTYLSNIPLVPTRNFQGQMTVSMRPVPARSVSRVVEVTRRFPFSHGAPLHVGDPAGIGVPDIFNPSGGHPPTMAEGDVPVFWACSATARNILIEAKPEIMIAPCAARCFITDIWAETVAI